MAKRHNNTQIIFDFCAIRYEWWPITTFYTILLCILFHWITFRFKRCYHIHSLDVRAVAFPKINNSYNYVIIFTHSIQLTAICENDSHRELSNKMRLRNEKWSVPKNNTFNFNWFDKLVDLKWIKRSWPTNVFNFLLYLNNNRQFCIANVFLMILNLRLCWTHLSDDSCQIHCWYCSL